MLIFWFGAVSGSPPTVPVVSKSGTVYEKALIERYIGQSRSPMTAFKLHTSAED